MSELLKKSFHCKACDSTLKTYKYMRKHLCSNKHKDNVVKNFPNTLMYRKIYGDIELYTGRLDLGKVGVYIIPVTKIKIVQKKNKYNDNKKSKKQKKDKDEEIVEPKLNLENYEQEYFHLDLIDMVRLIDRFADYMKFHKVDPDKWFNYEYFMKYRDINEDVIDVYVEVRDLVLDQDFLNLIKSK